MTKGFHFTLANMLRATAFAAVSCGAWSFWFSDQYQRTLDSYSMPVHVALAFFIVDAPILAVAALFGKAKDALLLSALLIFVGAFIVALLLPPIT